MFYAYIFDDQVGPGPRFIKICAYFPYPVKVGKRAQVGQAAGAATGIGFTVLSNGFAYSDDPAASQAICDRFGPDTVQVWFERWMAPHPAPAR